MFCFYFSGLLSFEAYEYLYIYLLNGLFLVLLLAITVRRILVKLMNMLFPTIMIRINCTIGL